MKTFKPQTYRYSEQFCEENIWWLASSLRHEGVDIEQIKVLFFSNRSKRVVMLNQRLAKSGHITVWDYHVVLQLEIDNQQWVFDFDSRLPFPVHYHEYLRNSFLDRAMLPSELEVWARVIPACIYLKHFYSDRSHMRGLIATEQYPDYPIIQPQAADPSITLAEFWDMTKNIDGCEVGPIQLD